MSAVVLYPKFPTKLEAEIYGDIPNVPPADDEDLRIPFDSYFPTKSRAHHPNDPAREAASADFSPRWRRPHTFHDVTRKFEDALHIACIITVLLALMVLA